jgi:hypothetical protein
LRNAAKYHCNVHEGGDTASYLFCSFGFSVQQPLRFSFRAHVLAHKAGQIC